MVTLTESQLGFFEDNGYLILRQVIPPARVVELRQAALDVVMGKDEGVRISNTVTLENGTRATQILEAYRANPILDQFTRHSELRAVAAQLMQTSEVRLWYDQIGYKEPRTGGAVGCHQDFYYWRHVSTTNMVTSWTALTEATVESGSVYVVPGSHLWGDIDCPLFNVFSRDPEYLINNCLNNEQRQAVVRQPLILEPGDVSFHHCLTLHGSFPNTSESPRIGYIHHYFPAEARYIAAKDIHKRHEIDVADGELIRGEQFPLLWSRS